MAVDILKQPLPQSRPKFKSPLEILAEILPNATGWKGSDWSEPPPPTPSPMPHCFDLVLPEGLTLLGAPAGAGKSTFAANVATAALRFGKRVALFSFEGEATTDRALRNALAAESVEVADGELVHIYGAEAHHAVPRASDQDTWNRIMAAQYNFIIIDPAVSLVSEDENSNAEVRKILTRFLTEIAEAKHPLGVLLLHHTRKRVNPNSKIPLELEQLRGASDWIGAADEVLIARRDWHEDAQRYEMTLRIGKSRHYGRENLWRTLRYDHIGDLPYPTLSRTEGGDNWKERRKDLAEETHAIRSQHILDALHRAGHPLTRAELEADTDISTFNLKQTLKIMQDENEIIKTGASVSTRYALPEHQLNGTQP